MKKSNGQLKNPCEWPSYRYENAKNLVNDNKQIFQKEKYLLLLITNVYLFIIHIRSLSFTSHY